MKRIGKYNVLERRIASRIWYLKTQKKRCRKRYLELDIKLNLLEHKFKEGLIY